MTRALRPLFASVADHRVGSHDPETLASRHAPADGNGGAVAPDAATRLDEALYLFTSLRLFGGVLHATPAELHHVGPIPEHLSVQLSALNVSLRSTTVVDERNLHSNKLRALETTSEYDVLVMLDTDTVVLQDFSDYLREDVVQAALTERNWIPPEAWLGLYEFFELTVPPQRYRTATGDEGIVPYFNTGVILVPQQYAASLHGTWLHYIRAILDRWWDLPPAIHTFWYYVDEIAFALAVSADSIPFSPMPFELNFPTHVEIPISARPPTTALRIVHHYHRLTSQGLMDVAYPEVNEQFHTVNDAVRRARLRPTARAAGTRVSVDLQAGDGRDAGAVHGRPRILIASVLDGRPGVREPDLNGIRAAVRAPRSGQATSPSDVPTWHDEVEYLYMSLRLHGGSLADSAAEVHHVGTLAPATRRNLQALNITLIPAGVVDPRHPRANKLQMLETSTPYDVLVMLDTDVVIARDFRDLLRTDTLCAMLTESYWITDDQWRLFHEVLGLRVPPRLPDGALPYFNSGVISVPRQFASILHATWLQIIRTLLDHWSELPPAIRANPWASYFIEETSFSIAVGAANLPLTPLPLAMNFPTHHDVALPLPAQPLRIIHNHHRLTARGLMVTPYEEVNHLFASITAAVHGVRDASLPTGRLGYHRPPPVGIVLD